jgi:N-acetylmuramic acid 6-phosphate etherase
LSSRRRKPNPNLQHLTTEQPNRSALELDDKSSLEIARIINAEDAKVAAAVARALPQIARAIDWIAARLKRGGRLIYVGAGTSGRVAALDAAECPPTFGTPRSQVQFIMSGGPRALGVAAEVSEDSRESGRREMAKRKPGKNDVVVGIAASGRTPFTIAAVEYARSRGAKTVAVTCNQNSSLEKAADLAIVTVVGPEVVAGSSRMKAGSAQKMVLNMLSTGAMTRLGYVYGNLMVNVHLANSKLMERGLAILESAAGVSRAEATRALLASGKSVPVALVMVKAQVNRAAAEKALRATDRDVRKAIQLADHTNSN